MSDQFVIWTRYEAPSGAIVRHTYGPFPTRSKAQTVLRRMTRDAELQGTDMDRVEAHVTKLLS